MVPPSLPDLAISAISSPSNRAAVYSVILTAFLRVCFLNSLAGATEGCRWVSFCQRMVRFRDERFEPWGTPRRKSRR